MLRLLLSCSLIKRDRPRSNPRPCERSRLCPSRSQTRRRDKPILNATVKITQGSPSFRQRVGERDGKPKPGPDAALRTRWRLVSRKGSGPPLDLFLSGKIPHPASSFSRSILHPGASFPLRSVLRFPGRA